jgi:two-component sensor histidine kinase/integral membrane sensor domain MASE1
MRQARVHIPPASRRTIFAFLALTVGYALAAVVGLHWSVAPGAGTSVWPASGLAIAALLLVGPKLWPAVFAGRLLTALVLASPQPLSADLLISLGATLSAVAPVLVLKRLRFDIRLTTLRSAILLIAAAIAAAAITAAFMFLATALSGSSLPRSTIVTLNGFIGHGVGVLLFTPLILSWAAPASPRWTPRTWGLFGVTVGAMGLMAALILLDLTPLPLRIWHLFPFAVAAAVAFTMRGASSAMIATALFALIGTIRGVGPLSISPNVSERILFGQHFIALATATMIVLAAISDERRGRERLERSEQALRSETEALETLNNTCQAIASELDLDRLVQRVVDAGRALTNAQFAAFFYNGRDEHGGILNLYAISGAPKSAFDSFGHPRATAIFEPTFNGTAVLRSDDVTQDPRYGQNAPHKGMPEGHLPVRSYLAAPVRSRSGEVLGGLFFGHPEPGVFTERSERLVVSIASQAAVGLDNARLLQDARREIERRREVERRQQLLIHELNHRVKNTLASVQSLAAQSFRGVTRVEQGQEALMDRIMALSSAHNVLTAESWEGADLHDVVVAATAPFTTRPESFSIVGPPLRLPPKVALAVSMALHELGTNALKYGSLSLPSGRVDLNWIVSDGGEPWATLTWVESGGPPVLKPARRGFGLRLIESGLTGELGARSDVSFEPLGVRCRLSFPLSAPDELVLS